jgi:cellulose synthase/poly-beta-1,6-N-acetylglucosamine synthase-like glycosyltransferase
MTDVADWRTMTDTAEVSDRPDEKPRLWRSSLLGKIYDSAVLRRTAFWGSLGALAWTHVGYPVLAATLARTHRRHVRTRDIEPLVTFIVAAHDEEAVIEWRLENVLALDYPPDRLEIVVVSDASTDATEAIVASIATCDDRLRLLRVPRGGKVAAQDHAVRQSGGEILAFSDANTEWKPDALRKLVRNFADEDVAYVCGTHFYERGDGTNREGVYARFEGWLRQNESRFGSITAGVGPIYAVRREDYVELDPRFGHDLALPYLLVRGGRRAVVEPDALAWEKPARDIRDEYRRKIRMFEHCWLILMQGRVLRRLGPLYTLQMVSHRHLRYASGALHVLLLASSATLAPAGRFYRVALGVQLAVLCAAATRSGVARYYVVVTWATLPALRNYLRAGVPPSWDKAEGTR